MSDNKDLYWEINNFNNKQKAVDFFEQFSAAFCVYSDSVEQLYTNYELMRPTSDDSGLIVLPNQYAFHDTFFHIDRDAIRPTGIRVYSGESFGRDDVLLSLPLKDNKRSNLIPFEKGIQIINKQYQARLKRAYFLPIILKGDLREYRKQTPYLHLHCLNVNKLTRLSEFEKTDIESAVAERFKHINKHKAVGL